MPNWCYSNVHFEGAISNITELAENIYKSITWMKENKYGYLNIPYFFSLKGFDVDSYTSRFIGPCRINFRGSISTDFPLKIYYYGDYACINTWFETAWYMDYDVLHLISMLYNVKFSAYSEEPNMDLFTKCSNAEINTYNYDYVIRPDYEQLENHNENNEVEFDYIIPVKDDDNSSRLVIDALGSFNIDYEKVPIEDQSDLGTNIYGVYYDSSE